MEIHERDHNSTDRIYAINPRRIIAIEFYPDARPPHMTIRMTDDFSIDNIHCDNSEYERLRDELKKVVGG